MELLWPWALLALTAVAATAAWTLFRPGRRELAVGSLTFWRQARDAVCPASHRLRGATTAWWLMLLGAVAAVCATARPARRAVQPGRLVALAVHRSAELAGPAGRAGILSAAETLLSRLGDRDGIFLMLPPETGPIAGPLTPGQVRRHLAELPAVPIPSHELTMVPPPPGVQHIYCVVPAGMPMLAGRKVTVVEIPTTLPAVTFDAIGAEMLSDGRVEVFVAARNQTDSPWRGELRCQSGEAIVGAVDKPIALAPRARGEVVFQVQASKFLSVTAASPAARAAPGRSSAFLIRREAAKRKVALIGADEPLLRRYIRADASLTPVSGVREADVVIANGVDPPADRPSLAINPPTSPPGWRRGEELHAVVLEGAQTRQDPVLRDVRLSGVAVRRLRPWTATAVTMDRPLVVLDGRTVLLRRRAGGNEGPEHIYLAFDVNTDNTNLAMNESFVVFLANCMRALSPGRTGRGAYEYTTPLQIGRRCALRAVGETSTEATAGEYPGPGLYTDANGRLEAVNLLGLRAATADVPPETAAARAPLPPEQRVQHSRELWPMLTIAAMGFWLAAWAFRKE